MRQANGRFGSLADLDIACAQTQKSPWPACQGVVGQDFRRNLPMLLDRKGFGAYETAGAAFRKL